MEKNLLQTELKKIQFSQITKKTLIILLAIYCIPVLYILTSAIGCEFDLNGYNSHIEIMCKTISTGIEEIKVTNTNIFGYLMGFNDWGHPEYYEIYRTVMFAGMLIVILFAVYFINIYDDEYTHLTFRQEVFCGLSPLKILSYKFWANVIMETVIYTILNLALYFGISFFLGYKIIFSEILFIFIGSILNIVCILAVESVSIALISIFRKKSVVIGIILAWILSDYIFYLGCVEDIWAMGKPTGIFLIFNPITYMYRINNYGMGIEIGTAIETALVVIPLIFVSWFGLNIFYKAHEM